MLVIGLTGGVATGKSTVAERLSQLGAVVIDADVIAREVVRPGEPALAEIARVFGPEVLRADGELDRARLGGIVFHDAVMRKKLEGIVHPPIRERMKERIARLRSEGSTCLVVCDIPLLYESKESLALVDKVAVVYASPKQQIARLMDRNGLAMAEAKARVEAQMPTAEKAERAEFVIDNSGSRDETIGQVDRLWKEWRAIAGCADRT